MCVCLCLRLRAKIRRKKSKNSFPWSLHREEKPCSAELKFSQSYLASIIFDRPSLCIELFVEGKKKGALNVYWSTVIVE